MATKLKFALLIAIVVTITILLILNQTRIQKTKKEGEKIGEEMAKKILFVVALNNFKDEELFYPQKVLRDAGFTTEIASANRSARSVAGKIVDAILLKEVNVSNYDAVVFVGGPGASAYFNDSTALSIAQKAAQEGKIVAAICIAPIILANAGLLEGKNATVWDSGSGEYISKLESKGATFIKKAVVQDGNIITANGPSAATQFGSTIAKALASKK